MVNAATVRRISQVWRQYQKFKQRKIGDFTVAELLKTAPDVEAKKRILIIACGEPPYSNMSCGFLGWEIEKEEGKQKKTQAKKESKEPD